MNFTVIGLFENSDAANTARKELIEAGVTSSAIDVSPSKLNTNQQVHPSGALEEDENTGGFWNWLFGDDVETKRRYSHVSSSKTVVTAYAENRVEADRISGILDNSGALDVDEHYQKMNLSANTTGEDITIPVVKEDIAVGKREVEAGGIRVRTKVIEKPVEESIRLRSERVYITRTPVDRPVASSDAFKDKTITMTEHAEEAVVEKTARVVEEVSVGKEIDEKIETVTDTVRETQVDIDNSLKGSLQTTANTVGHGKKTNLAAGFTNGRVDRAFSNVHDANRYFDFLVENGYDSDDITVLMSEATKKTFYADNEHISNTAEEALKGAGAGSAIGGTIGAILGAIAAVGGAVLIPGIGLAVAGPLAAVLGGAGVGGASGALIGALTKAGLSESVATEYKNAMDNGEVIISVDTKDNTTIFRDLSYGREIYNGAVTTV